MYDADTLVEHLGVSGTVPAVQRAADVVFAAWSERDTAKFDAAITEFEAVVRRVAARGGKKV